MYIGERVARMVFCICKSPARLRTPSRRPYSSGKGAEREGVLHGENSKLVALPVVRTISTRKYDENDDDDDDDDDDDERT